MVRIRWFFPCVSVLIALAFLAAGAAEAQYKLPKVYEKGPPYETYEPFPEAPAKGAPVNITVGYQTYYTQSWSSVAVNGLKLWKKFLPAGSNVSFSLGLQGAIITNAMLGGNASGGPMPFVGSDEGTPFAVIVVAVDGNTAIDSKSAHPHSR